MNNSTKKEAVLLANLGTSDLEVYLDSKGYIPLWERRQPNEAEDHSQLSDPQRDIWKKRVTLIKDNLCGELDVPPIERERGLPFKFTDLTHKINQVYLDNKTHWQQRIFASRLVGIVHKAQESFDIKKVILFVSKQKKLHENDTLYLFEVLQKWFQDTYGIEISAEYIDPDINLSRDQDLLFEFYYKYFKRLDPKYTILLSLKGGTPAMQTALRTQSITISVEKPIILIETELHISCILEGQPSPAYLTSYWKYVRTQKYEAVRQLLERWDFDGAMKILEDWKLYIDELIALNIVDNDIRTQKSLLEQLIKTLDVTIAYFNLDSSGKSRFKIKPRDDLGVVKQLKEDYDRLLNLYTQCRIYWEINQVANFLSRMTSFCEETLHYLIDELDGTKYFNKYKYPNDWYLDKDKLCNADRLWTYFSKLESKFDSFRKWDFTRNSNYKLKGRFSKLNFVAALVRFRFDKEEQTAWQEITASLEKLDYWIDQRNKLIHSAEGVSKANMANLLEHDRRESENNQTAVDACKKDEILDEMTNIMAQTRQLLDQAKRDYIGLDQPYYIYTDVKAWIVDKLMTDGLE